MAANNDIQILLSKLKDKISLNQGKLRQRASRLGDSDSETIIDNKILNIRELIKSHRHKLQIEERGNASVFFDIEDVEL